jgi:hypothetical protein
MIGRDGANERVYRGLLRLYPHAFRDRFADELVQLFSDQLRDARDQRGLPGTAMTWLRTLGDVATSAASEHARRDRIVAHSLAVSPSTSTRALGVAGILGGTVLLAAFLVNIAPDVNALRLILFNAGAMALVIAVHRRQASGATALALLGAVPAFLANAWYLVMVVLAIGRPHPFAGDFGLIFFFAGAAMWLGDAWFGLVTLRLGLVARWAALALAIGSLLAFTGMDRLELTSASNPTIFGPLSLGGIALNGIGWILLGIDVATRRRSPEDGTAGVRTRG